MSHLLSPRIHFRGEFVTNVPTANNDVVVSVVDPVKVRVDTQGMNDADFQQWFAGLTPDGRLRAAWNYYGNASCSFENVRVTSVEMNGQLIQDSALEPLLGSTVTLNRALMVDVDAEGALGTQIFCETLRLNDSAGVILQGKPTRAYSRWLHFGRNLAIGGFTGAAAIWQMSILPTPTPTLWGDDRPNSPVVQALRAATNGTGEGITIRFCTYLIATEKSDAELAADFAAGEKTINPGRGIVIGTIGRWLPGEMTSVTSARLLHPRVGALTIAGSNRLGPIVAHVDTNRRVVVLDLVSTFPEVGRPPIKIDLGQIMLGVFPPTGNRPIPIAPIPYNQANYEQRAGIVEIPYDPAIEPLMQGRPLVVLHRGSGNAPPLFIERATVIETDDRGIYLQEGEPQTIQLRVTRFGAAAPPGVVIHLEEIDLNSTNGTQPFLTLPTPVTVGNDGIAQVTMTANAAGNRVVRFFADQEELPNQFDPLLSYFTNIRILPADNYEHIPIDQITFQFIFDEVLRYYYLLYPAMNDRMDLSDEFAVTDNAAEVFKRIAKSNWENWSYMPRTRELSDGKRALLERWCEKVGA